MTYAADSTASATLSGRELALKRRQAMATQGKSALAKGVAAGRPAASPRSTSAAAGPAQTTAQSGAATPMTPAVAIAPAGNGRQASRARREALSRAGKAALQGASTRPTGRVRPTRQAGLVEAGVQPGAVAGHAAAITAGCGCGCNGAKGGCGQSAPAAEVSGDAAVRPAVAETSFTASTHLPAAPTGRALARARRAALAQDGKAGLKRVAQATRIAAALPTQDWQVAIAKGATGRQVAMQHRRVQSLTGRTVAANTATRPTGRVRARVDLPAPPKVEEGHTLSGHTVTGTMVERSKKVTGNEPGSCRPITGTEYIGAEQFETLCGTRPAPAPSKVSVSSTLREHRVTGTEVGRSPKVTGDEPGTCRAITGTEYLSAEQYESFCGSKPAPAPAKIGITATPKGKTVTGTQVVPTPKVTGYEPGADRPITGTHYAEPVPDTAPDKVAVTHTAHGKPVTGTAVGHTAKITGDEPGACRGITGTQYLAAEQYEEVCKTTPPMPPHKVSVMSSRKELPVSGTEVGRSPKVTGDEPGACRAITGTLYYNPADFGELCKVSGPRKVGAMETLAGRTVTGTEVGRSPKVSGDEEGGCIPVTGTDYAGVNPEVCAVSTPVAPVSKVAVDQTWHGQPVTGTYVGRSAKVTGDEYGGCAPISGTPYIGRSQYATFCPAPDVAEQAARVRLGATIPAAAVTGDRPGFGASPVTGDERGACEPVTGTPYIGPDNAPVQCVTAASGRFVPRARTWEEPPRPPAPQDFSIKSPAREAWERAFADVTGTAFTSERITGPINKADGLITGTPEFRHRGAQAQQLTQEEILAAARRLTGEGSQAGPRITGDAWHAQSRVTGTEGASALARNPSLRGHPRGEGVSAPRFRDIERPAAPDSRITGSSGNTAKGALVTVSGGARA